MTKLYLLLIVKEKPPVLLRHLPRVSKQKLMLQKFLQKTGAMLVNPLNSLTEWHRSLKISDYQIKYTFLSQNSIFINLY